MKRELVTKQLWKNARVPPWLDLLSNAKLPLGYDFARTIKMRIEEKIYNSVHNRDKR